MDKNGNGGEGNSNGDIRRQEIEIFQDWVLRKPPRQIAQERGLPVRTVYQRLKEIEKQMIAG